MGEPYCGIEKGENGIEAATGHLERADKECYERVVYIYIYNL